MDDLAPRELLLSLYQSGLNGVEGAARVALHLQHHPITGDLSAVAIGKAASAMMVGAQKVLGVQLQRGLVITKHGYGRMLGPHITTLESSHPVPDQSSLDAGTQLLDFLAATPVEQPLLFLLSGGASSLVEVLAPSMDLMRLGSLNRWLLGSGYPIDKINRIRRCCSLIKGGGLLNYCRGHPVTQLLISDVPGDRLEVIGSGLLVAPLQDARPKLKLPKELQSLMPVMNEQVMNMSSAGIAESYIIATNWMALANIRIHAERVGIVVRHIESPCVATVTELSTHINHLVTAGEPGLYLWGGEPSLMLPEQPGRGGRSQHLALLMARLINGHPEISILIGASDGSDGPTADAGAWVDGYSKRRGDEAGLSLSSSLAAFDSGGYLQQIGALIATGPTGSNVMDLILVLKR